MARLFTRSLLLSKPQLLSRSPSSSAPTSLHLRSLLPPALSTRPFVTRPDGDLTSPQRPFLDGELWVTTMREKISDSRNEVTQLFVSALATVVGSPEVATTRIYSASTIYGWRFGSRISLDQANALRTNPEVLSVYRDRRYKINYYCFEPYNPIRRGGHGPRWLGKKFDDGISEIEFQAYEKRANRKMRSLSTDNGYSRDDERWLIFVTNPKSFPSKDELISSYIEILARVVGREQARHRIYSIAIRSYFFLGFGAYVPKHLLAKLKNLPWVGVGVRCVRPDTIH